MKFIVLVGKDNTGKSKTLEKTIDELIKKGAIVKDYSSHKLNNFKTYIANKSGLNPRKYKDITIVLELGTHLIGITTYGDDRSFVQSKVNFFEDIGCTHIIFASHPSGSVYEYLVELAEARNFQDFHAIFKVGCLNITNHSNLKKLQDDSDTHAINEILHWI